MYQDSPYLNLGKGQFEKTDNALPDIFESGLVVMVAGYDNDGGLYLFENEKYPLCYCRPGENMFRYRTGPV